MKAELLNYFGDDIMVANVARVSYDKEAIEAGEKEAKLIKFLAEHKHTTPFRHPQLQFRIECPIFVERQLFTHQVGWARNCLHGDSKIRFKTSSGSNFDIKISDLYHQWENGRPHQNTPKDKQYVRNRIKKRKLRVLNEVSGEFEIGHIKDIFKSGIKKLYRIKSQNGEYIDCSADHKIWTQNGWKTINSGLSSGDLIGLNGIAMVGNGEYRLFQNLKNDKESNLSVTDMSIKYGCSYHTIRKWLKINKLQFNKSLHQFKPGQTPWNKNVTGYTLNLSEEMRKRRGQSVLKGNKSHFWRGGITSERGLIGQWTRNVAAQVHKKYSYTCQKCGGYGKLHAHHILPVCLYPDKAYEFNNLVTVCKKCHYDIHFSAETERLFAEQFLSKNEIKTRIFGKNRVNRGNNKLHVHFSKIEEIAYIGEHETYDIEVDGSHHNFIANGIVVHNSLSGRYVDFSDSYWVPPVLRYQSKSSKQGSDGDLSPEDNQKFQHKIENILKQSAELYKEMSDFGIAKELCRVHLPLALETKFIWTGSFHAFTHLCALRLKKDAQKETRDLVREMLNLVKNIEGNPFQYSLAAFGLE